MGQLEMLQWVLFPVILISLVLSVVFSYKSRRSADGRKRGINAARMNISMGVMMMFISFIQLFMSDESTLKVVIGAIFLVVGLFNLFAGLRNLSAYRATERG
ncbi:YtpI family protein [Paenibacillus sp. PAMC21692]|uniref:YtpI family protein n=1 Tax=Paenibacillus sp. PAMC21692 TaxID=2762320 RepID=UPI00164E7911|nr:YtpI family protein [Paenibacillus sp. PAMC21692]QNK59928.1 YtpI family protein [Paenibacillus sp. PAMC21692]